MAQKALWGWCPGSNAWVKMQVSAVGQLVIDPTAIFDDTHYGVSGDLLHAPTSNAFFDHDADPYAHQDTGGKCGITAATLTGNITLTPYVDTIHQWLTLGGVDRDVTLATLGAKVGDIFIVRNNNIYTSVNKLNIFQGVTFLDSIYALAIKSFIYDGTNWVGHDIASSISDATSYNMSLGRQAQAYNMGFAIGPDSRAYDNGVAVGRSAYGYNEGVAIGTAAVGANYGVGIGRSANSGAKHYAIALGVNAKCTRTAETAVNIEDYSSPRGNYTQGRFFGITTSAAPLEIYLGGLAGERFILRPSSALAFRITVVARDNVANEVAMYTFEGVIKRDAANNTVMSHLDTTVVYEDDATWDCVVAADDANEALIITVTGDATNPTRWAAVLEGVEVIF